MASGKLSPTHATLSGNISSSSRQSLKGTVASSDLITDHNRLTNRGKADQHPIEAITGLRKELDSKLDSNTALPLIEEAVKNKAKGLYFDAAKELAEKSYWYLTAEIDPATNSGTKESIISGPYDLDTAGVETVNGKTGEVQLTAADVDAYSKEEVYTKEETEMAIANLVIEVDGGRIEQ